MLCFELALVGLRCDRLGMSICQGLQGWRMRVCKGAGHLFQHLDAGMDEAQLRCEMLCSMDGL
jgi:hypothetical protein